MNDHASLCMIMHTIRVNNTMLGAAMATGSMKEKS